MYCTQQVIFISLCEWIKWWICQMYLSTLRTCGRHSLQTFTALAVIYGEPFHSLYRSVVALTRISRWPDVICFSASNVANSLHTYTAAVRAHIYLDCIRNRVTNILYVPFFLLSILFRLVAYMCVPGGRIDLCAHTFFPATMINVREYFSKVIPHMNCREGQIQKHLCLSNVRYT